MTTPRRPLLLSLCLVSLLLCRPVYAGRLDTEFEKLLGRVVSWGMAESSGVDRDPLLERWVCGIGAKVSAAAPRQDIPYTFRIQDVSIANAYALPGGHIFVTRGLLDSVESDDELASVLAHEAGHVSKRHATQQIGENLLFLLAVNSLDDKRYGDVKTAARLYNVLRTLAKSREMESQADEEGIRYAAAAGYDPRGLDSFLGKLNGSRNEPPQLVQYLSTHPTPKKRLEKNARDPWIRLEAPAQRAAIAAGYEARGLGGAAEVVRRGGNPLRMPLPGGRRTAASGEGRQRVAEQVERIYRDLGAPYRTQQYGSRLQQIMLANARLDDMRWIYLAARAYAVEAMTEDVYERTIRSARLARPTYERLQDFDEAPDPAGLNAALGRREVDEALEKLRGAPVQLRRASQATLAVLADLNNPFYSPKGNAAWVRYATLEGLLRYAESELSRADRASGEAWRKLSLARIRRFEAEIDVWTGRDAARRSLWQDLVTRRFGQAPAADGASGAATIQAALAVQVGRPPEEAARGRGTTPWADWVVLQKGTPENIATAMRLLTLDLERETAARE